MSILNMSTDVINAIHKLREEAQSLSATYDLDITYIINILVINGTENPIEIIMKCTRSWPLHIVMKRLEGLFNKSSRFMKFMTCVNNSWIPLDQSKMLQEYDDILAETNYTIYLSNI